MDTGKLYSLMESNPRLTSRQYAELAEKTGLADDIDARELRLREIQKEIRRIVRDSKRDPQMAFVSITEQHGDSVDDIYVPAKACTAKEAQRVLDDYATDIDGTYRRAMAFRDYWNGTPFNYQLQFNWG